MNDSSTPPQRKGHGCLFYGCLTGVVLLLLLILMTFFAIRFVRNKINAYTDSKPMALPKIEMAEGELKELQGRVKSFGDAMDQGKPTEPLVLSEREINALIANSDQTKQLADHVHVAVAGDEVKGQVSIPLSQLGWIGKGRYLNGDATFNVSLRNGVLIVTAQEVRVQGKPLPESFMGALRQENLAKDVYKDAKHAEALRKLETIEVKDGKVTIKARQQAANPAPAGPAP